MILNSLLFSIFSLPSLVKASTIHAVAFDMIFSCLGGSIIIDVWSRTITLDLASKIGLKVAAAAVNSIFMVNLSIYYRIPVPFRSSLFMI